MKALGGGGGGGGGGNELKGPFGSPICESGGSVLGPELHRSGWLLVGLGSVVECLFI